MTERSDDGVVVHEDDGVLVIVLDRPAARNAVDERMSRAIARAVDRLDGDDALAAGIITGAGGTFCSGMDLKAFLRGDRPEVPGRGFAGFTQQPPRKPVIAAVEGYALAGGFELVLACDLVVAAETATFGLPEVTRGLIAGSGGLLRLGERIPLQIAMEHALTGRSLTAAEAHRWGLVNRLTVTGDALSAAMTLAREIVANAPLAVQETKRLITQSGDWAPEERWPQQDEALRRIFATRDAAEGASAFAAKRPPVWEGR